MKIDTRTIVVAAIAVVIAVLGYMLLVPAKMAGTEIGRACGGDRTCSSRRGDPSRRARSSS